MGKIMQKPMEKQIIEIQKVYLGETYAAPSRLSKAFCEIQN